MTHSFDNSAEYPTGTDTTTNSPIDTTYSCGASATVLVVAIIYGGSTARAGGAPTFAEVTMTQADSQRYGNVNPEVSAELWYLINPSKVAGSTLRVPNTGGLTTKLWISSYISATGATAYDAAGGAGTVGTNPTASVTVGATGAVKVAVVGDGAQNWNPTGRTGTQLYDRDLGSWGGGAQYHIATATGAQSMSWTFGTSEDNGVCVVSLKEGTLYNLVVQDASSVTATDPITVTENAIYNLTVQDASSVSAADAPALTQVHGLTAQDASSVTSADSAALVQDHTLVVQEAASDTSVDPLTLAVISNLSVEDAASVTFVESITLTGGVTDLVVQDASCVTSLDAVPGLNQCLLPSADVLDGGWTNEVGSQVNLYESVNEVDPSDSDYIQSEENPANSPCVLKLAAGIDPESSSGHTLSYRFSKDIAAATVQDLVIQLRQGYVSEVSPGTLIAEWTHTDISETPSTVTQTLTAEQADTITNYSDLYVRLVGV